MIDLKQTPFSPKMKAQVQSVLSAAKDMIGATDELMPIMHLINSANGEVHIVGTFFTDDGKSKNLFIEACRKIRDDIDADMAIFISESWTVEGAAADDFQANRHIYKSVSDHPGKKDALIMQIETMTGTWFGQTPILGKGKGRTVEEMKFTKADKIEGRFTGLIQKQEIH